MEELKKQRKYLRSHTTKLLGKDKNSEEVIKLQVLKEQLFEKRKELKDVDKQILSLMKSTDEEIEKEYEVCEDYQEKIIEAMKTIDLNLMEREEKKESLETPNENETTKKSNCTARLPKIELPTFNGDINSWFSFWQVFQANIGQRKDLSLIEKLTYLLSLLRGEPAKMVSSFAATAENYDDIVEILHRQYGQKNKIVDLNVKKILEMKPVSSVAQINELKSLITELSIHLRNLKNLGINTENCSPIINTKIKQLIPSELLLIYERQKNENEETSTEELILFLQKEINYRENLTSSLDPKAPTFKPSSCSSSQYRPALRRQQNWQYRAPLQPPRIGAYQPAHLRQNYNQESHQMKNPRSTTAEKTKIICFKCNQVGHIARVCPRM